MAAAGNEGADVDTAPAYPCAYELPNVLCVTASDRADERPSFANVGARSVDLAAPGVGITGPLPGGNWGYASGTSFAAPHAAGAAALLLAWAPTARPAVLIAALIGSTVPAPAFSGATVSGGRLDVSAALDAVRATPWPDPPTPKPRPIPTPAPPPAPTVPPSPTTPATGAIRAELKLRRAAEGTDGSNVLALITRRARGAVEVTYRARGHLLRLRASIRAGRVRIDRRLPRALRGGDGGIVTLRWARGAGVRPASLRLRAAAQPAHLRRDRATLRDGRLRVTGRISPRAHGSRPPRTGLW